MPTVTSQTKPSFLQQLWGRFSSPEQQPQAAPAAPAKPVKASERWGAVPYKGFSVYKTDYSTGRPETLPTVFDTTQTEANLAKTGKADPRYKENVEPSLLHALYDAQKISPHIKISPEEVVTLIAQEGRSDLGANPKDIMGGWTQNPRAVELNNKLQEMGYNIYDAGTAALLLDKQMTAKRLSIRHNKNVPWQAVWNGLGETKTGRTGYDYAREYGMNAKNIGMNQEALNIVRQHMREPG